MTDAADDAGVEHHPPLSNFDLSGLRKPRNGLVYIFKSAVDGYWAITSDPDIAQQDATGYPLGEIVEYEDYGDYESGEYGELRTLEVGDIDGEGNETVERTECWNCGYNRPTWEACPECGEYGGESA